MNAFDVVHGLGYTYHDSTHGSAHYPAHDAVSTWEVANELNRRGYQIQTHVPIIEIPLSKRAAISIGIDVGLEGYRIPHTSAHPYRSPTGRSEIPVATWNALVTYATNMANGLLSKKFAIPAWAQSMIHSGQLSGLGVAESEGGFWSSVGKWVNDNPWAVQSAGDLVSNYGAHLTAKNVQDAILEVQKNTEGNLTKADIPALIEMWKASGAIQPGQENIVAAGAAAATTPSWMMPVMILGGIGLVVLLMKR